MEIKAITYNFDDQKYLPLSILNAKSSFYSFRQYNLSNSDYLQRFKNLVDIATSVGGKLHDDAMLELLAQETYSQTFAECDPDEQIKVDHLASERYLAVILIQHSDQKRYLKLMMELQNDFTKGKTTYPKDTVKAYQLLVEYRSAPNPKEIVKEAQGIAFVQKSKYGGPYKYKEVKKS